MRQWRSVTDWYNGGFSAGFILKIAPEPVPRSKRGRAVRAVTLEVLLMGRDRNGENYERQDEGESAGRACDIARPGCGFAVCSGSGASASCGITYAVGRRHEKHVEQDRDPGRGKARWRNENRGEQRRLEGNWQEH
ncbi:protein of unknown function [Pararobbsia alpina]